MPTLHNRIDSLERRRIAPNGPSLIIIRALTRDGDHSPALTRVWSNDQEVSRLPGEPDDAFDSRVEATFGTGHSAKLLFGQ